MTKAKSISKKDFNTAVKAAYKLGIIDGRDRTTKKFKAKVDQLTIANNKMKIVNKSLVEVLKDADNEEFGLRSKLCSRGKRLCYVRLPQTYIHQIVRALKRTKKYKTLRKNIIKAFERDTLTKFKPLTTVYRKVKSNKKNIK
jgi:uncharacterized 2Fe-2S/4Fe-4S cluster protein (DUF4445 family)